MTHTDDRDAQRMAALARYQVMDSPREAAFDEIVELIAAICDVPMAVGALKEGAFDFLTKPFAIDHLSAAIRRAMERPCRAEW